MLHEKRMEMGSGREAALEGYGFCRLVVFVGKHTFRVNYAETVQPVAEHGVQHLVEIAREVFLVGAYLFRKLHDGQVLLQMLPFAHPFREFL